MRSGISTLSASICLLVAGSAWADPIQEGARAPDTAGDVPAGPSVATGATPPTHDQAAAQSATHEPSEPGRTAKNALYVEGLGPGLFYSIDYDRAFGDFSARVGFSYLSVSASGTSTSGASGGSASASFIAIPITVSYLGIGSVRNMLELGAGATILHLGAGASAFETSSKSSATESATAVLPTALAGYRFQPADGGFFFRVGLSLLFAGSSLPVLPWPYVGLGGTFGP